MRHQYDSNVKAAHIVDENTWVLSIMRDKKSPKPEHAFLLLEGVKDDQAVIYKYDLYVDERDSNRTGYAEIVKKDEKGTPEEIKEWYKKIVLKNNTEKNGENIRALTWDISEEQAENLQIAIKEDMDKQDTDKQIKYALSGINSISGQSDTGSSKEGHSCYTWARDKVNKLGDHRINIPIKYTDYVIAVTSHSIGK